MKRTQRGQTLVEMAMVAPFLIMILLVVIDCGRAAYAYATLSGATRDGARAAITTGSLRPDNGWVVGAVKQNAFGVQLSPASCINDAPPAIPSMAANTGLMSGLTCFMGFFSGACRAAPCPDTATSRRSSGRPV